MKFKDKEIREAFGERIKKTLHRFKPTVAAEE